MRWFKIFDLSNEAQHEVILENGMELSPDSDGWAMISPYGDFPHEKGIQRVTREAAQELVNSTRGIFGRIKRAVVGIPVYSGHPDSPELARIYPDKRQHGSFSEFQARDDGLYGRLVLNNSGAEIVESGAKWLSPRWLARQVAIEGGKKILVPFSLASAGLVKNPNLPVHSLNNSDIMKDKLIALLGLKPEATEDEIMAAITGKINASKEAETKTEAANARIKALEVELGNERAVKVTLENSATAYRTAFEGERKSTIGRVIEDAVKAGRITPAESQEWTATLSNAADFPAKVKELETKQPTVKTGFSTDGLGSQRTLDLSNEDARRGELAKVIKGFQDTGLSYNDSYAAAMKSRPDIVEAMKPKAKS